MLNEKQTNTSFTMQQLFDPNVNNDHEFWLNNVELTDTNGFKSSEWGSLLWYLQHTIADYVDKTRITIPELISSFIQWIRLLTILLPCVYCRQRFEPYMASVEIDEHKISARDFIFNTHNVVNRELGKSIIPIHLKEMYLSRYVLHIYNNDNNNNQLPIEWSTSFWIILMVFALNLPNPLNLHLPRHQLIANSLFEFYMLSFKLIPHDTNTKCSSTTTFYYQMQDIMNKENNEAMLFDAINNGRKTCFQWLWSIRKKLHVEWFKTCRDEHLFIESKFRAKQSKKVHDVIYGNIYKPEIDILLAKMHVHIQS
jgi:hypothetical protein